MSRINRGLMSSNSSEWETPQEFFDSLNAKFNFTLDPCATKENAKCKKFYTKEDDGLSKSWKGERVFMNPPYGKEIKSWVIKAQFAWQFKGALVCCLLPARTDTRWFQNYVLPYATVRFLPGRLKFEGATNSAPFPSLLALYW